MERKKLIFFANDDYVMNINGGELKRFFGDIIDITCHIVSETLDENSLRCDLLLTLTPIDLYTIRKYVHGETEILQGSRTLTLDSYERLLALPYNTKALIANINKRTVFQLISFLIQMGIDNIDFYPVFPGTAADPVYHDIPICIIPTSIDLSDMGIINGKEIINLMGRRITIETYKAIMAKLGIDNKILDDKLNGMTGKLAIQHLTDIPVSMMYRTETILNAVINTIDDGILVTNDENKIIYTNTAFNKMFRVQTPSPRFRYLDPSVLPANTYRELLKSRDNDVKLLRVKEVDKSFLISKNNIFIDDNHIGSAITFKDTTKMEDMEMQLRGMIAKRGYKAKYTFSDIIGSSQPMRECILRAEKIARIDKTVLILGESGTGKEMFAHALHLSSPRKERPFVAINCAALSPDLLGSELFGYEEGAFTGAKRGGKKGLFEAAHRGTIFLDEIGDISLSIQIKLLRVLQEHEIRRLGGNEIIKVDVRVITATNHNLDRLVEEGKFRLDLYYRLNAFTLMIPALRERSQDIKLISLSLLEELGFAYKKISGELQEFLGGYEWKGNVRELMNCIEYMSYMGGEILTLDDLPPNFRCQTDSGAYSSAHSSTLGSSYSSSLGSSHLEKKVDKVISYDGFGREDSRLINFLLCSLRGRAMGRRRLKKLCEENGLNITEAKVRSILEYLKMEGCIEYRIPGKVGACITEKGEKWVKNGLD